MVSVFAAVVVVPLTTPPTLEPTEPTVFPTCGLTVLTGCEPVLLSPVICWPTLVPTEDTVWAILFVTVVAGTGVPVCVQLEHPLNGVVSEDAPAPGDVDPPGEVDPAPGEVAVPDVPRDTKRASTRWPAPDAREPARTPGRRARAVVAASA